MLFFVALNTYSLIVISLHYGMLFVIVCHAIFIDFLWFFNVFDTFSLVFHAFSCISYVLHIHKPDQAARPGVAYGQNPPEPTPRTLRKLRPIGYGRLKLESFNYVLSMRNGNFPIDSSARGLLSEAPAPSGSSWPAPSGSYVQNPPDSYGQRGPEPMARSPRNMAKTYEMYCNSLNFIVFH